jgi:predicted transposase/invertase (TIGR01784 family)
MNDGTRVNIEVQLRDVGSMDRRSLFYWSREYVEGIHAGQDYHELPRVIAINILGAEFLPLDEMHASFHLWEDSHRDYLLTDALELHFIDMVKFGRLKERDIENNLLHRWLTFFDKNANDEIIDKIIVMDTAIAKAQEKISFVAQDKEMLHAYHMREMAVLDYNSGINAARRDGIVIGEQQGIAIGEQRGEQKGIAIGEQRGIAIGEKQGIAIGKQQGIAIGEQRGEQKAQTEYVLKLFRKGMPIEEISKYTDLSIDEVNNILNDSKAL